MIHRFRLTLSVEGPFLTHAAGAGRAGLDAACARDGEGRLYIPGTLILGKLRHALNDLARWTGDTQTVALLKRLGAEGFEDNRGQLHIGDLTAENHSPAEDEIVRIRKEEETGTVARGAMFVIEAPIGPREEVVFKGELRILGGPKLDDALLSRLKKALHWIDQVGAERGVGFGRIRKMSLVQLDPENFIQKHPPIADQLHLRLTFHDPLMVGVRLATDNLFVSDIVVPGSALRGAFANMMLAEKSLPLGRMVRDALKGDALADEFDSIHFSHFFPVARDERSPSRAQAIPHSWAVSDSGEWLDFSKGRDPADRRLSFSPDWKSGSWKKASKACNTVFPARRLVVRTEIDEEMKRSAETKLFAHDMVETNKHDWIGVINFSRVHSANREKVKETFAQLVAGGIAGIGKTNAFAAIEISDGVHTAMSIDNSCNRVALVLQTKACLRDSGDGVYDADTLKRSYAVALEVGSAPDLKLVDLFVREHWAGGTFLARQMSEPYRPLVLTEVGSVFVFECGSEGRKVVNGWLASGIPEHKSASGIFAHRDGFGQLALPPVTP
jgi:hypothetical protein